MSMPAAVPAGADVTRPAKAWPGEWAAPVAMRCDSPATARQTRRQHQPIRPEAVALGALAPFAVVRGPAAWASGCSKLASSTPATPVAATAAPSIARRPLASRCHRA